MLLLGFLILVSRKISWPNSKIFRDSASGSLGGEFFRSTLASLDETILLIL